jgi:hypothetical protein
MRFVVKKKGIIWGIITGLLFLLFPVSSYTQAERQTFVPLRKVAVLPFLIIRPQTSGEKMVRGLWGEFFFRAGYVPSMAGSELTTIFYRKLIQLGRCEVIPMGKIEVVIKQTKHTDFRRDPLGVAVYMGGELGVYAVVIAGVYRFEQRLGSAFGVQQPASVAFDTHLVKVEDKKVIWSGRFDETQSSLSENLLKASTFIKGGGYWVTVEKLAAIGVVSILRTFPFLVL